MSFSRNLLNITILLCIYLNKGFTEGAQDRESGTVDYHTIQINSLTPSSSCVLSSKEYDTKSSLRVVHKHGPCSPLKSGKAPRLDHDDILRHDQARVASIHSKLSNNFADQLKPTDSKDIPVKDESKSKSETDLGSGSYIVTIGIGTPKHNQPLIVDTGSDLTWTKCKQCGRSTSCNSLTKPIFNPSLSSSFYKVPPSSQVCNDLISLDINRDCLAPRRTGLEHKSDLDRAYKNVKSALAPRCCYGIKYGDNSSSDGFLAEDKFTLTSSVVFDGIHFGCGEHDAYFNEKPAGVLGLSRHTLSFPSQTAKTYNNIFSYCLPSSDSYTGHFTFGPTGISNSVKYTPIITLPKMPSLYGLDIVGITVGDTKLKIPLTVFSTPSAIIDSGTVITRLPPKAYAALRTAFMEKMKKYTATSALEVLLDTCYDPTGLDTMAVPKVLFSFRGGTTVDFGLDGILYRYDRTHVCLAFAGNDKDDDVAIFGSVQQKTLQVVYDKAGGRVGFAPNGCS